MSIICKYITPPSASDSNLEQYEYYLVWFSPKNSIECWLFLDYRLNDIISKNIVNRKSAENISSLLEEDTSEITLVAENLTRNEYDTLKNAAKSDNVFRVYKNGSYEKVAIQNFSNEIRNSAQRFNIELRIVTIDKA